MDYANINVIKPWGSEYLINKTKESSTWFLNLDPGKKTSLHCHPKKKTGFVLLDGEVEIELGFYKKIKLKGPDKVMLRPGMFHSTKAISKFGAKILEVESPSDKEDLVRFKDSYGRESTPYEGKEKMEPLESGALLFKEPEFNKKNIYNFKNLTITLEKNTDEKKLINRDKKIIFAILEGGLQSEDSRFVLTAGDIVRSDTINKLCEVFTVKKHIVYLTIDKNE